MTMYFLVYTVFQLALLSFFLIVSHNKKGMQDLFEKAKSTISEHIKNVFEEGELNEEVVVRDFRTTSPH